MKGIRLSELSKQIEWVLQREFGTKTYWVIGEITDFKIYEQKKHAYFSLVEKHQDKTVAKFSVTSWSASTQRILKIEQETGQKIKDNLQVLVLVRVQYSAEHGLKLELEDIDKNFLLGSIAQQREETIRKLLAENPEYVQFIQGELVTRNKKLESPLVMQRIAVLSSEKSAGLEDFLHTLEQNQYGYRFEILPFYSSVQGTGAAEEMRKKLVEVFEASKTQTIDCVVIVRGGGSQLDFGMFDEYPLVRAIARFPVCPVLTGIGHQKDETLCDKVAKYSLKTPTKVAEFLLHHCRNFELSLQDQVKNIALLATQCVQKKWTNLSDARVSLLGKSQQQMRKHEVKQAQALHKLNFGSKMYLEAKQNSLKEFQQNLRFSLQHQSNQHREQQQQQRFVLEAIAKAGIEKKRQWLNKQQVLVQENAKHQLIQKEEALRMHLQQLQAGAKAGIYKISTQWQQALQDWKWKIAQQLAKEKQHQEKWTKQLLEQSQQQLNNQKNELRILEKTIQLSDPKNLLKRGFSLTLKNGKIVRSSKELSEGEIIEIQLHEGKVKAEVKEKKEP